MKTVFSHTLAVLLAAGALSACSSDMSRPNAEGTSDRLVFPEPYSLTFNNKQGTFPTAEELDKMRPGLTKHDIYQILGRPHYDEGFFRVREWNYLLNFYTPGVGVNPKGSGVEGVTTCQYKVLFDKNLYARSFYWKPVFPANAVCPPPTQKPEPQVIIREIVTTPSKIRN